MFSKKTQGNAYFACQLNTAEGYSRVHNKHDPCPQDLPLVRGCGAWANPGQSSGAWAARTVVEVGGGECLSQGLLVPGTEVPMSMESGQKSIRCCFLDRELGLQCGD